MGHMSVQWWITTQTHKKVVGLHLTHVHFCVKFACSHGVGFFRVLWFPLTVQKYALRLMGDLCRISTMWF